MFQWYCDNVWQATRCECAAAGAYEEEDFVSGNIKKTHYISSPDGLNAMMIEDQSEQEN